jgi:hypothetical protein
LRVMGLFKRSELKVSTAMLKVNTAKEISNSR